MDSFEKIVAQISAEKPWSGLLYWVFFLVWRWSLTIFTVLVCLASRQNEVVSILLILISVFLDYRYVPRAPAFRLSDTEFVRKTCLGEYILGTNPKFIRSFFIRLVLLAFLVWIAIYMVLYGLEQFESSRSILSTFESVFVFVSFLYIFVVSASLIAFCSYLYPPVRHPTHEIKMDLNKQAEKFNVRDYVKHGYMGDSDTFIQIKFVYPIIFLFFMAASSVVLRSASSITDSLTERFWGLSLGLITMSTSIAICSGAVTTWKSRSIAKRYIQLIEQSSGQQ